MQRRSFIKGSAVGAASVLVMESIGCGGPSVETEVGIAQSVIKALQVLFPNTPSLAKVAKLFTDFNSDWVSGKFDSARTIFDNLDILVGQVIDDLGVNASDRVKFILVTLGATLRAIAALIKEQGLSSPSAAKSAQGIAPQTVNRVNQLADPAVAAGLLKAVRR